MTSIVCVPQKIAENFYYPASWVCISITSTEDKIANITCEHGNIKGLLRVHFHDIDGPANGMNLITMTQAQLIAVFIKKWYNKVPLILVHCHAGVSRSAAVVAAATKYFTGNDKIYFDEFCPNMTVYRKVYEALSESYTSDN